MLIGVDAGALAVAAAAADRAAALVAAVRLDELAASIGAAMPGSRSAEVAIRLATLCSEHHDRPRPRPLRARRRPQDRVGRLRGDRA